MNTNRTPHLQTSNFNVETLKGQSLIRQVRESADRLVKDLDNRIFESLARGQVNISTLKFIYVLLCSCSLTIASLSRSHAVR